MFFLNCNFCSHYSYDFSVKQKVDNLFFFCSSACAGGVEQSFVKKKQGVPVSVCWVKEPKDAGGSKAVL